ncbi:hypothetical protein EXU57_03860 [Segetibacter sp. 3557_3]|uniref:HU family DNA-binding protein n=1 Tax=Segetibacter sp. 3557_3 TaxID=2547429 RepID=UPI0010583B64|nr:HU family DNA-binding protein [Segetibacter sp. 3557_3]TDH29212.1 hypothetical protein EXU57_03860 [Segetibacter sp. 3557_3]
MVELLYKYFILHKSLAIPGIGFFTMNQQPAQLDFVHKVVLPPVPQINFLPGCEQVDESIVDFVADETRSSREKSSQIISRFFDTLRNNLYSNKQVQLPFFGLLEVGADGPTFQPAASMVSYFAPAHAERIVREDAEHHILVGDAVRTNTQMQQHFHEGSRRNTTDRWWIYALIIAIVAIAAIAFYYWRMQSMQQA